MEGTQTELHQEIIHNNLDQDQVRYTEENPQSYMYSETKNKQWHS